MKKIILWLALSLALLSSIQASGDEKSKITLNLSNVSIGEVLKEIQKKQVLTLFTAQNNSLPQKT